MRTENALRDALEALEIEQSREMELLQARVTHIQQEGAVQLQKIEFDFTNQMRELKAAYGNQVLMDIPTCASQYDRGCRHDVTPECQLLLLLTSQKVLALIQSHVYCEDCLAVLTIEASVADSTLLSEHGQTDT